MTDAIATCFVSFSNLIQDVQILSSFCSIRIFKVWFRQLQKTDDQDIHE